MAHRRTLLAFPMHAPVEKHQLEFEPSREADDVQDWTMLAAGDKIRFLPKDGGELSGWVDTVTEDGEVLWIHLAAGGGRRLLLCTEGSVVQCIL